MGKVSINIPCYNRSKMLRECVQSFIDQTYQDWELVLVDDGSEEDLTFVSDMDPRVKYIRQDHLGISRAFNFALDNSTGDFIMPFGSDDLAVSPDGSRRTLLEDLVHFIGTHDCEAVYCNYWVKSPDGVSRRLLMKTPKDDKEAYKMMLHSQYIPHPGSLWKKWAMPRYDESLESAVDWELYLTAMENGARFRHRKMKLWTYRTGHPREAGSKRQADCCDRVLRKRGYYFNKEDRKGYAA